MSDGYTTPPNAFSPESEDLRVAAEMERESMEDYERSEESEPEIKIELLEERTPVEEIKVGGNIINSVEFCRRITSNYVNSVNLIDTEYNRLLTKPQIIRIDRYVKNLLMYWIRKYGRIVRTLYSHEVRKEWEILLQPKSAAEFLETIRFKNMLTDRNLVVLQSMLEELNSYFGAQGCIYCLAIMLNVYRYQIHVTVDVEKLYLAISSFMDYLKITVTDPDEVIRTILTHDPLVTLRVILERGSEL